MEEARLLPNVNVIEQNSNFSSSHQTPMLVKAESRDDEETIFDSRKSSITSSENQINAKIVDKNLNIINLILILFGVLSISFIVYEGYLLMDKLHPDNIAGPTLGLIISIYAVTSGSAYFASKTSASLQSSWSRNGSFTNKHLFSGINLFFGVCMILCMALIGSDSKLPLANIVGLTLGTILLAIGIFPFITQISACQLHQMHYTQMWRSQ